MQLSTSAIDAPRREEVLRLRPLGGMTMEGLRRIAVIALIIALALVLLVILGFAAYTIFLFAKWLIELVW